MAATNPDEIFLRAAIVREAYEWIGTPYVHGGDIKGPNGAADCAMSLIRIFSNAIGIPPADYDPRPYSPNWHIHQNEQRYMGGMEKFARVVTQPTVGDIALYRFGRHASHGAVIVSEDLVIHAHKRAGNVELCERSSLLPWLDSYWSVFA